MNTRIVTSFYGYDVSRVFREQKPDYYDPLKLACSLYFVMSHDMRRRLIAHGFPADQVRVHPVSIDVDDYPYRVHALEDDSPLRLISAARFVEKKGLDDLLAGHGDRQAASAAAPSRAGS